VQCLFYLHIQPFVVLRAGASSSVHLTGFPFSIENVLIIRLLPLAVNAGWQKVPLEVKMLAAARDWWYNAVVAGIWVYPAQDVLNYCNFNLKAG